RKADFAPGLIVASILRNDANISSKVSISRQTGDCGDQLLNLNENCASIARHLVRLSSRESQKKFYAGDDIVERTLIDDWVAFSKHFTNDTNVETALNELNSVLEKRQLLVGNNLSLADIFVWSRIVFSNINCSTFTNIDRWLNFVGNQLCNLNAFEYFDEIEQKKMQETYKQQEKPTSVQKKEASKKVKQNISKEEGKYVDLPEAEMGKVVVRFPPEASGFLHIGHAKAALLNQYYQLAFNGKLIFRFDDTNPEKEKEDYEEVIRQDIELLHIKPDICSYTSDYFDFFLEKCEELIKNGKAYVDDTEPEKMKQEREQRIESTNRNNSIEKNLKLWEEMKKGTDYGQKCCVRAKIDMNSDNGCMRDPALYRCKKEKHPKTGDKYHVYPTYDFACPLIDSIEGVTHALRTTEYTDRDAQYYWILEALGMRKPYIWAYSRLNMMNTVLSKRKLTWFVENKIVDGWDDPRMPTVRGILRRGLTVDGLKEFIKAQGSSRSVVFMEWDKIWSFNKKVIDPIAPRYMAVEAKNAVIVYISDAKEDIIQVNVHPKNVDLGKRNVKVGNKLIIDQSDASLIKEGDVVTFINWGNLKVNKILKDNKTGLVSEIHCNLNLENKDFKKTLKVTWIETSNMIKATAVYYEHLISKPLLGKDDDFKDFINRDSKKEIQFYIEEDAKNLKERDIIQILRKGFFICDEPFDESTVLHTGIVTPLRLISIPDGSSDMNIFPKEIQDWKQNLKEKTPSQSKDVKQAKSSIANADELDVKIRQQGDRVRAMKSEKKSKEELKPEIDLLLKLKQAFKELTGYDWSPEYSSKEKQDMEKANDKNCLEELEKKIQEQGDKIRQMKSKKKSKEELKPEIDLLLSLKDDYKKLSGKEWKPPANQSEANKQKGDAAPLANNVDVSSLNLKIKQQGDKIRKMKSDKKSKDDLKPEIECLWKLKEEYKTLTGNEWKSTTDSEIKNKSTENKNDEKTDVTPLSLKIKEQGDKIRKMKSDKKSKEELKPEIDCLLKLKDEYKKLTGNEWKPEEESASKKSLSQQKAKETKTPEKELRSKKIESAKLNEKKEEKQGAKKQTRLGLEVKKSENLADWYTEVITKAELIEYYDVSGCYILRPWAFSIWESIQNHFDKCIKTLGVKNCYFPMFVSSHALEREKTHIADFAPEVAWVTKSGSSDLAEPIAIRPTSETVMYPSFAKWIKSHRDLPIKINQWCNVVRWEFKNPTPFLRTREFLWQEGHTAHMTREDAVAEVYQILDFYAEVYEELLAIPVIKGTKTEKEKFAGGEFTTTIEAYVAVNGRGVQAATSHHLGQNFSKMFEIIFEDPSEAGKKIFVYQNSWGISTRSIGVMIMVHSDDKGLVLPPRVAAVQVIIIPCGITVQTKDDEKQHLLQKCEELRHILTAAGIRCESDLSDHNSPGWKYNHWELKGVPIRIELGPKDLKESKFVAARRDNGAKINVMWNAAVGEIAKMLTDIHNTLFENAKKIRDEHLVVTDNWPEFVRKLDEKCIIMAPFCGGIQCEDEIKKNSAKEDQNDASGPLMGAKSLCIPHKQPKEITNEKCVNSNCKCKPKFYTLFGRSY
ncbi:bifunctional glutamate/proline--tRNA ligase-like protein, partial [Dinothrombium tinctorium]